MIIGRTNKLKIYSIEFDIIKVNLEFKIKK